MAFISEWTGTSAIIVINRTGLFSKVSREVTIPEYVSLVL